MAQVWTYYAPLLIHRGDGVIGFTFRFAEFEERMTEELAWSAIMQWSKEIAGFIPQEKDDLPVVPLGWTLVSAKQGAAVQSPKDNGREN